MQQWKRSLRISHKFVKNFFAGYSFRYAHTQAPHDRQIYRHLWSESITPIPDRGSSQIRHNRLENLYVAAQRLDGLQIASNQVLSFCQRIGDPNQPSNGFKEGPVFVRGEVKTGYGGGLCLMATNLFKLFLDGGCQILERHCHSIDAYGAARFYTLGQDAAVAYGYKDLIICNHSPVNLQLSLTVEPEKGFVMSRLWGEAVCPWQVQIFSWVLEELSGTGLRESVSGWVVSTHRYKKDLPHHGFSASTSSRSSGRSSNSKSSLSWSMDYQTISTYAPCFKS